MEATPMNAVSQGPGPPPDAVSGGIPMAPSEPPPLPSPVANSPSLEQIMDGGVMPPRPVPPQSQHLPRQPPQQLQQPPRVQSTVPSQHPHSQQAAVGPGPIPADETRTGEGGSAVPPTGGKAGVDGEDGAERRKGRRKIEIEYIEDKTRRHITFSKRKHGIMKKAYELSTLTGTQLLLLVASETGHVYTFATPKLQPLITKSEGKSLIQMCLNSETPEATSAPFPHNAITTRAGDDGRPEKKQRVAPRDYASYTEHSMILPRFEPSPIQQQYQEQAGLNSIQSLSSKPAAPAIPAAPPQFSQNYMRPYPTTPTMASMYPYGTPGASPYRAVTPNYVYPHHAQMMRGYTDPMDAVRNAVTHGSFAPTGGMPHSDQ